jgi:predicted RNA-binding Zn ribbon-like protein
MRKSGREHHGGAADVAALRLLGGRLCLDFANTVDPRHGDHPHEFLDGYADLMRWSAHVGALGDGEGERLLDRAQDNPAEADRVFQAARTLRERLYRIFSSVAAGAPPDTADLETLGHAHADAMTHAKLVASDGAYRWGWDEGVGRLDRMLWPIACDAADLLTTGRLERIRECPGAGGCGWLFYDTSRNGKRRWCSMEACGNRSKGRRHYRRRRELAP